MKKLNSNKGFTLVELLAVIVVLAIVMGLAVVGISSVLDNTRKNAFASDAKSYIAGARALVNSDQANALLGIETMYSPACNKAQTVYIPLAAITLDSGGKSPYGHYYYIGSSKNKVIYDTTTNTYYSQIKTSASVISATNRAGSLDGTEKQASYVRVVSSVNSVGTCTFKYYIYLTDGVRKISATTVAGNTGSLSEDDISADKVTNV